jgi:exonuclease SbcC
MIPLKLSIEGLYSYREKQEIDFEKLTSAGLFGIFGAVGSGKSSILEAMMIALYGESERLSKRGENIGLINLQSQKLEIRFEYLVGKNEGVRYLSVYTLKRKTKNFDELDRADLKIYQWQDENWVPLPAKDASSILGMKFDDFRRTIIIPQGKFREFVELKDSERNEMLQELFQLNKFDLSQPVRTLSSLANADFIRVEAQLNELSDTSEETEQQLKDNIEEHSRVIVEMEKQLQATQQRLVALQSLEELHAQWKDYQDRLESLSEQQPKLDVLRKELAIYKRTTALFGPLYLSKNDNESRLKRANDLLSETNIKLAELESSWPAVEARFKEAEILHSKRESRRERINHLQKIIQGNDLKRELQKTESAGEKLSMQLKDVLDSVERSKANTLSFAKYRATVEEQIDSNDIRLQLGLVATSGQTFVDESNNFFQKQKENNLELAELKTQLEGILSEWIDTEHKSLSEWGEGLEREEKEFTHRKDELLKQAGLSAFVALVQNGEACPLCGSFEHPSVFEGNHDELKSTEDGLQSIRKRLDKYRIDIRKADQLQGSISSLEKEMLRMEEDFDKKKSVHVKLMEGVVSLSIATWQDAQKRLEINKEKDRELNKLIDDLKKEETQLEKMLQQKEALDKELGELAAQSASIQGKITLIDSEVNSDKDDWWQKYLAMDNASILGDIDKVEKSIVQAETDWRVASDAAAKCQSDIAVLHGAQKTLTENIQSESETLAKIIEDWSKLLLEEETSTAAVVEVINSSLDESTISKHLSDFDSQLYATRKRLEELSKTDGVDQSNAPEIERLKEGGSKLSADLEKMKEARVVAQEKMKRLLADRAKGAEFIAQRNALEKRLTNLKELEVLFRGRGFVSYISHFYLQELCAAANIRFRKLTRERLAIDVDQENNFYVIDYLNEGKRRLLKTLSGGQTFQASLCLALALAERVKVINESERSFFFLDEGFGALDKESLSVVLETIKSLKHENRVVGLISHVEELQQELDMSLHVRLDKERGSLILTE